MQLALKDDHTLLRQALNEAADLARLRYANADAIEVFEKGAGDPVTSLDLEIDALLKCRLRPQRPDYGWLSEETIDDDARLKQSHLFVIDPLDGTRALIKRRPHFTVCGALVRNGVPVIGIVINPLTDEIFEATLGSGATLNGRPIGVSGRTELEGARIVGPEDMFRHPAWPEAWPAMTIDNPNSIAYRLCLVAAGERDACVRLQSTNDWDLAGAKLIVEEAGGRITHHDGAPLRFNAPKPKHKSVIASGPALYPEIFRRVHKIRLPAVKEE